LKLLNYNKVLCLSPHPDDVEYGMLGSIAKFKDTSFDVVTLSAGGEFDKNGGFASEDRHVECENIWKSLKNLNGSFLIMDYIKNISEDELIYELEKKHDLSNYDSIFVPPTIDSHQDHRKMSSISHSLVRKNKCGIMEYATPSTLTDWIPNFFVDISEFKTFKLNNLNFFTSQKDKSYFKDNSIEIFHSNYQCSKNGLTYVEKFKIIKAFN
jgi:LmbE family N-acetylglucosaminyl deacetylase